MSSIEAVPLIADDQIATTEAGTLTGVAQVALDRAEIQQAISAVSTAVAREDDDLGTGDTVLVALDVAVVMAAQSAEQSVEAKAETDLAVAYPVAPGAPSATTILVVQDPAAQNHEAHALDLVS